METINSLTSVKRGRLLALAVLFLVFLPNIVMTFFTAYKIWALCTEPPARVLDYIIIASGIFLFIVGGSFFIMMIFWLFEFNPCVGYAYNDVSWKSGFVFNKKESIDELNQKGNIKILKRWNPVCMPFYLFYFIFSGSLWRALNP